MSKLIYQVCVGKPSKLYDHCTKSVYQYAQKIGATYIKQTKPILWIKPDPFTSNRSKECQARALPLPIFEKENAFSYIDKFDQIAIIDSDVFIRDDAPDIFGVLHADTAFAAVVERDMPINQAYVDKIRNYSKMQYQVFSKKMFLYNHRGYEFMNMGVIAFNSQKLKPYLKGQTPREFLERPEFKPFVDGQGTWKWSTDQTLLNWWIRKEQMRIQRLDWRFNGLYTANTRIKDCHFVHFFLKDKLPERGENVEELMRQI